MAKIAKYDCKGNNCGEVILDDSFVKIAVNLQMVKDYLVALRNNSRQWSANTKTRAEINHSNQKPHPQKGTGKARQGFLGSPQYKGGGRVFGPRPKDVHTKVNKKERKAVISFLISEKIKEDSLKILQVDSLEKPSTKGVSLLLEKLNLKGQRLLFIGSGKEEEINLKKSLNNIPKVNFLLVGNLNGYDVVLSKNVFVLESVFDKLKEMFLEKK